MLTATDVIIGALVSVILSSVVNGNIGSGMPARVKRRI